MKHFRTIAVVFFPGENQSSRKLLEDATTIARWMSAELHILACARDQAAITNSLHTGDCSPRTPVRVYLHLFAGGFVEGLFEELEKSRADLLLLEYDSKLNELKNAVIEACPIPILLVPDNFVDSSRSANLSNSL